jgi:hypothetical protein
MKRALPLLLLLVASVAFAQTTSGKTSGLSNAQLKRLRATKLRYLVPTKVPRGFKVARFELEPHKDPIMVHFSITYKKGSSRIIIQMSSEGLGDLFFDEDADKGKPHGTLTWRSSLFKEDWTIEYQTEQAQRHWHIQWIELPGKHFPRHLSAIGYGCEPWVGKQMLESLRWLR